jgi:hypothetical protein
MVDKSDVTFLSHSMENRKEFLLKMYEVLWDNINRHILMPWQSIAVLIGTFALFSAVEKKIIRAGLKNLDSDISGKAALK